MSKKITISKVKEFAKSKDNKIEELGIEIIPYIGFQQKKSIINLIANNSISILDDTKKIKKIDYATKIMSFELILTKYYSNVDFNTIDSIEEPEKRSQKLIEYYDILKSCGIIDHVLDNVPDFEIEFFTECIDKQIIEEIKTHGSLEDIVDDFLNKIVNKIPDKEGILKIINDIGGQMKDLDPDKLELVKDAVNFNRQNKSGDTIKKNEEIINNVKEFVKNKPEEKSDK